MVRYFSVTYVLIALSLGEPTVRLALGCATEVHSQSAHSKKVTAWAKYWNSKKSHRAPSSSTAQANDAKMTDAKVADAKTADIKAADVKMADGTTDTAWSKDRLWGGQDSTRWKPEAILANAVSEALALGYSEAGALDVLVSVPVKMLYSDVRPYGDGQTNASITFGKFSQESGLAAPPVVATWITFTDGSHKLRIRYRKMAKLDSSREGKLTYILNGAQHVQTFESPQALSSFSGEVYEVTWTAKDALMEWGDLYQNRVAYFQPPGMSEVFPIDFRNVVVDAPDLLAKISPDKQSLAKGNLLDPEQASVQSLGMTQTIPFDLLKKKNFAQDLNASHYTPVIGIHNDFLDQPTAVGNGDTTVILPPHSPFKMAYICFDGRNIDAEQNLNVPSGGGWHEIGDPAETVINSLEEAAPVFGYANGKPGADASYAYGLTDVAVIRRLKPGQALVTSSGVTTTAEGYSDTRGTGVASGRNYHWFIFDQPHEVCAVEWVHPCVPNKSNSVGTNCSAGK